MRSESASKHGPCPLRLRRDAPSIPAALSLPRDVPFGTILLRVEGSVRAVEHVLVGSLSKRLDHFGAPLVAPAARALIFFGARRFQRCHFSPGCWRRGGLTCDIVADLIESVVVVGSCGSLGGPQGPTL